VPRFYIAATAAMPFFGSSLFQVGEDEIQRNNQEIRKSGKEREECGLSTTEGIAVAHPWI